MTRLKISAYLVAILLTVSIAAKAIGSLQPPNPALRGFTEGCEDKPKPCWYGIVPGMMNNDEAHRVIEETGYELAASQGLNFYLTPCETTCCKEIILYPDNQPTDTIAFSQCSNVYLGDLINTFNDFPKAFEGIPNAFSLLDGTVRFFPVSRNPYKPIEYFLLQQKAGQ